MVSIRQILFYTKYTFFPLLLKLGFRLIFGSLLVVSLISSEIIQQFIFMWLLLWPACFRHTFLFPVISQRKTPCIYYFYFQFDSSFTGKCTYFCAYQHIISLPKGKGAQGKGAHFSSYFHQSGGESLALYFLAFSFSLQNSIWQTSPS